MTKSSIRRICVFCGSSAGAHRIYGDTARELGRALAAREIDLVFGGGSVGLMGILADEMLARGREVIGIIPHGLATREVAHPGLTELKVVPSMHERKALMAEMSDAFVAMPGGFGTFEELCEIITWAQLGIHGKPIGVLNVQGYYDPFLALIERAVAEEFIRPQYQRLIVVAREVDDLMRELEAYEPPPGIIKWVNLGES